MIKVFLVDDEAIARINLRCMINWEAAGFSICGEADNGLDALKKVEELQPDIIFTDMNMAGMNGVEFIKSTRKLLPTARFVAFSGFDDFEFVRQSLKEGALDYIVKHRIDASTLLSTLSTIKEGIVQESIDKQKADKIMAMASSGKVYIRKNALLNLLNGYIQEDFEKIIKEYDIRLDMRNLAVVVARIDNFYMHKEKFSSQEFAVFIETIENLFSTICSEIGKTEYTYLDDGKFTFIMSFAGNVSEAAINSKVMANISAIEGMGKRFLNITFSFGVSAICPSFQQIPDFYKEACSALEKGYYKGSGYIVKMSEISSEGMQKNFIGLSAFEQKGIITHIKEVDKEKVLLLIENIFQNVKEKKVAYNSMKIMSVELINIFESVIRELSVPVEAVHIPGLNLYEEVVKFRTIDEMILWFKQLFGKLMDVLLKDNIREGHSPIIKKAIEYLKKNYDKDLSLSEVSEVVKVSPQYLSKLFKDECGKGFANYLNCIRIEQAKTLMTKGVKVRDLADRSGFNNYTYFFTVFKTLTGITPQQFEKELHLKRK